MEALKELKFIQTHPPRWIRARVPDGPRYIHLKETLRGLNLHTVCQEARCPNVGECWSHGTATFILLGDICTRRCHFCAIRHGKPPLLDEQETEHVAEAVEALGLDYVVLTSVTRDDLTDHGASHFAQAIEAIHRRRPQCKIEVLIPDFRGESVLVARVVNTPLTVLAHNLETVPRLYGSVRPGADYKRSLRVLSAAKESRADILTKSGLMLGLGETREEVLAVCKDLRSAGCDILTLGQYLRPSAEQLPVARHVPPSEFAELGDAARQLGFRHVESGPLVRSSYHAWQYVS
ncbi:MAG: lipoyl synthase [Verrucomicrobiia bacterium]